MVVFVAIMMAVILAILAVILVNIELPPNNKLWKLGIRTGGGFVTFLSFIFSFLVLLMWFIASFFRKQMIICDANGCLIVGKSFWESAEHETRFQWSEVTAMRVKDGSRKGDRSFFIEVHGAEMRLMSRTIFNKKEFGELVGLFRQSTPHLQN